jgi:hypothetical protein
LFGAGHLTTAESDRPMPADSPVTMISYIDRQLGRPPRGRDKYGDEVDVIDVNEVEIVRAQFTD